MPASVGLLYLFCCIARQVNMYVMPLAIVVDDTKKKKNNMWNARTLCQNKYTRAKQPEERKKRFSVIITAHDSYIFSVKSNRMCGIHRVECYSWIAAIFWSVPVTSNCRLSLLSVQHLCKCYMELWGIRGSQRNQSRNGLKPDNIHSKKNRPFQVIHMEGSNRIQWNVDLMHTIKRTKYCFCVYWA